MSTRTSHYQRPAGLNVIRNITSVLNLANVVESLSGEHDAGFKPGTCPMTPGRIAVNAIGAVGIGAFTGMKVARFVRLSQQASDTTQPAVVSNRSLALTATLSAIGISQEVARLVTGKSLLKKRPYSRLSTATQVLILASSVWALVLDVRELYSRYGELPASTLVDLADVPVGRQPLTRQQIEAADALLAAGTITPGEHKRIVGKS